MGAFCESIRGILVYMCNVLVYLRVCVLRVLVCLCVVCNETHLAVTGLCAASQ